MTSMVSAKAKLARLTFAVAVLALALTVLAMCRAQGESGASSSGPLRINSGKTELVFPAPAGSSKWSATAGGFLLCSARGNVPVTLTRVAPRDAKSAAAFSSVTRALRIHPRKPPLVGEPIIGGYGKPPWIGGLGNPHETRLLGSIANAEGATFTPPRCDKTTSAPGEEAMELLVTATVGEQGMSFHGVSVEYTSQGRRYRTAVPVKVELCGVGVQNSDC